MPKKPKHNLKRGVDFTGWVSNEQLCAFERRDSRMLKLFDTASEAEWERAGGLPRSDVIRVKVQRVR